MPVHRWIWKSARRSQTFCGCRSQLCQAFIFPEPLIGEMLSIFAGSNRNRISGRHIMTPRRNHIAAIAAGIATIGLATMIHAQQAPRAIDDALLKSVGTAADPYPGAWLTYGRNQNETRYSPL